MSDKQDYNWLDDPFDEKKAAAEQQQSGMTGRSKLFVGIGCLAVVLVIAVLAFMGVSMLGVMVL